MPDPATPDAVLDAIREELVAIDVDAGESLEMSSCWDELDIDSIEVIELVAALEERYGVDMANEDYGKLGSAGDLARRVCELIGAAAPR